MNNGNTILAYTLFLDKMIPVHSSGLHSIRNPLVFLMHFNISKYNFIYSEIFPCPYPTCTFT